MRSTRPEAALALGLTALFLNANAPALPSALEAGWQGQPVCRLLYQTATNRALRCTFPPGVGHVRHFHPRHFGYAISGGRMRITTAQGTREAELKTGSSYSSAGVGWHEVVNIGPTPVIYLIFEDWPPG
jgi:quercetin dioxygenase-like cupin family protein